MSQKTNVIYAIASFNTTNGENALDEQALILKNDKKNIIFLTSKNVKPTEIKDVLIAVLISNHSKCFFTCKVTGYKVLGDKKYLYKAQILQKKKLRCKTVEK